MLGEMDFRCNMLLYTLLLFIQFTISNAKLLFENSDFLKADSVNLEKLTIEFSRSNFEKEKRIPDHQLKNEIARRFRRGMETVNNTAKSEVICLLFKILLFKSLVYLCHKVKRN